MNNNLLNYFVNNQAAEYALDFLCMFIASLIVLTLHEFAHAFVAYRCGDPTAKMCHRLSLNPFRHFDLVGLIMFALVGFGWAKPVPINPTNFRHYRRGIILTSIAGIVMNIIAAFLIYPLYLLSYRLYDVVSTQQAAFFVWLLLMVLLSIYSLNLSFAVFNLLPFPPLDGFNFAQATFGSYRAVIKFLRRYGNMILIGLIAECFICRLLVKIGVDFAGYFNILEYIMKFAVNIIGFPITKFWGLFIK